MTTLKQKIMKKSLLVLILLVLVTAPVRSQKAPFTPKDALDVKSISVGDITDDGLLIAGTVRSRHGRMNTDHGRFGDPNYVAPNLSELVIINSSTGKTTSLLEMPSVIGKYAWSPDGKDLAFIKYEADRFNLYIYNNAKNRTKQVKLKTNLAIASNSVLEWMPGGESVIIYLRPEGWAVRADSVFTEATSGPITVYDSKRPFLKWEELANIADLTNVALVDLSTGISSELLPEGMYNDLNITSDGQYLTYIESHPVKTAYDRKGGAKYEQFRISINEPGVRDTLIKMTEKSIRPIWNEDKTMYAYTDSDKIFIRLVFEAEAKMISRDTTEVIKEDTIKSKFSVVRWSPDGRYLLASSKRGYWMVDPEGEEDMKLVYQFPDDPDKAPRSDIVSWSPDGDYWYMSYSARDKWERGLVRYNLKDNKTDELVKDSNLYSQWRMSKDGSRLFYSFSDGDMPDDLFVVNRDFSDIKRLTDLNPWIKERMITRSELIKYLDSDGKELYGILYYPVDYEPGNKYPLVCEIYEGFFNNGYSYSMNLIANAGYFGFKPSVNLIQGYPGEAWIKGVTAGINKLIEMELVDPDKLGVHGTSYGGYATSLLISQTDRFAAAINISGKTNIISFLGDSPRIGTRNYAAAEVGQDRIGETLWDAPMKYFATSAILFADRINTPHLLLTGEGDWNVPAMNTRELYYALRRLGKEVVWVNYINGGHGAGAASNESDFYDHWERILEWYRSHFDKPNEKE